MEIQKNIVITRQGTKPILIDTFYTRTKTRQPVLIFCHGYKGFKDWGAWNLMAETLAMAGICVVKFNFSHNGGTVDNPIDFPDLDAFGHNNYTKELRDLGDIMDWVQTHFKDNALVNTKAITLLGHSRGGGIAALKAAEDARVKRLITLAGVSDFGIRFGSADEISKWKARGVKYVINGRTKQEMPHYYQFYEDFVKHRARLDIKKATEELKIPHLIIHGDKDTSVALEEARAMHEWNPNSTLCIIKDADHVFNTRHPWKKNNLSEAMKTVIDSVKQFQ